MFLLFSPCSTVAASINALATVTFEDFVKIWFPHLSDKLSTWISKGLCRYSWWIFYSVSWYVHVKILHMLLRAHWRHKCAWKYVRSLAYKFLHFQRYQESTGKEWPDSLPFTNLIFNILLCSSHQHLLIMPRIDPISPSTEEDFLFTMVSHLE